MMRGSDLVVEAWRNARTGASSPVPSVLVMLAIVVGVLGGTLADVAGIGARAAEYRDAGGAVLILRAPGRVDSAACDSLDAVASGAIRRAEADVLPSGTPGTPIPTYEITPGLANLLAPGVPLTGDVWISAEVAQRFGLRVGEVLSTAGAPLVGGIYPYPDDGRQPALAFAVLLPVASSAPFDECWATTWPESAQLESLLRSTRVVSLPTSAEDVTVMQLNGSLGRRFEGAALFWERPTRYGGLAGMVAALVAQLVTVGLRRIELASARHSGVSALDLVAIVLLECVAWVGPAFLAGFAVLAWFLRIAAPGDAGTVASLAAFSWGGVVGAGLVGAVIAVLMSGEQSLFGSLRRRR